MKKPLYCIQDIKAALYESPVLMLNVDTAVRWFSQCIDQVPMMKRHPSDFVLHEIGEFDEASGKVEPYEDKLYVLNGLDCIRIQEQESRQNGETSQPESQISDDSSIQQSPQGGNST